MSKDLPINLDNTNDIYRRQASLGGNKITRSVDNTEGNTTLLWGRVTQVYYQKGTCDFKIQGQSNIFVDNSGSDGTLSAPIPVDYYGKNYDGHPFIKTRLIQKGNKVLVAFVNGSTANPVIIGVYPDNSESYELLSPALDNKISDNTEDTNYRVNNEIEITPANQMIYKSGDGSWAKSMQGRSFLIVQGNKNFELEKVSSCYENIPYFYKDNASDEPVNYPTPVYSENTKAPEWLLVHEGNWELDGSSDKHRTRFYVNQEGELQIVFFTLDKPEELLVVDGNKDTGFTIMKQFDSDTPMDKNSKDYVKFNVGDNNEISMSVSPSTDSKEQAQSLEIKSDGIYVNGKLLTSLVGDNQGNSDINVDDVKDIINSTTGIEDWDKFKDSVHKAAQDAQQAADEAKKAGDEADAAGQDAAQAGLDAKLAGENAAQKVSDLKDKMLYYLSLSPEKDLYVPGKYLILNEDVTIKNGFIKEGYIDDAAINSASIKDAAITSAKIKDLAVYSAKIANAAITNAKIADLSVGTAKIRDLAVTDEKVGKLTFNHMIGETLDANLINVTNLTADSIKAHSITADKITVGNLGELSPNLGNITGGSIDAGNVNIDNLPADDPNILTPEKKAKLRNTVDALQEAIKAQNDFQNSVGAPSDTCNTLNMNMSKLIADTTPLLRDMNSNSEYDHTLIDTDIDNVNIELNNLSHKAITTIGKTADGKNTIYTGAFAPSNPHIGDIWAKPSDDNSNEGTFEIYGQNGWFSPTKDIYNRVQSQINNLPKSYYQGNEPTGDIATGSIWYKTKQDAMGNISFDMYVYQDGKWVAYNDSAIEGLNAKINQVAQTADGKNSIYSSSTAPTNPKDNDIWIDTGNGNAIKVYINGKWVSPNANQEQINQQITDAFQNVPSVYYQSTQPTGNIVEGSTWYKTGANNTYTMYTYKNGQWVGLLDDNINTAVDNSMSSLQKSGANLIINSDFSQGSYGWALPQGDTTISSDTFKGHKYITINKSGVSGTPFYWISQDKVPVTPGESLSFSAWIKHTGLNPNGSAINLNWYADTTSSRKSWFSKFFNSTTDTDWEFYKCENITVPDGIHYADFSFTLPANGNVSYALPMFVYGSTVPSWNPSPLDSIQLNNSYKGVTISNESGIKIQSKNNLISLNADVGIDIYGNGKHNMSLDNNGNLVMRGNLVAGDISGVNIGGVTFKGNDMNLTNVLNVNGAIKSNGVNIDSRGLHVTNGDIILGTKGTLIGAPGIIVNGWIDEDGTWVDSDHDNGYQQIPVEGGSNLTFAVGQVPDYSRNQIAFYDSNKSLINWITNQDFSRTHSVTINAPSNAAYVSFSVFTDYGNTSPNYPMYIYQNGSTNTLLMSDGTMIANNAVLNGSLTSNNVNITGGSINLVKPDGNVAFHVDSTGNAVFSGNLSSVDIMGNNSTLSGMLTVNGTLSAASGNVIMNNDGLTINKGSINIGNGNETTFRVDDHGTLLANNATITGDLTATKLTIASNADVSINVNGQFKVDRDGNVYAGSLTLKNGTINSSNVYGSSIIGSTLKLADTYLNEFYGTQLSRTQYDEYGLRSGYTLNGVNMNRHGVVTHAAGVRERSMNYLAMALSGQGWLDGSGNVHSSTTDIYTQSIQQLLALNAVLHIRFTNGPSNVFSNGGTRRIIFYDSNNNVISSYESSSNNIDVTPPPNASGFKLCVYVGNNGYNNWLNATRYSKLTNTGNYMDTEDSVIAWQGDSSNPGYDICSFNYGTTDASQLNVTRDNMWITALQFDSSQLSDGDIIKLEMEINYDNSYYKPGGQFWLSVNGKSMNDSNPYFGSTNLKYAVVGNYKYVWYLTYHSDLGNYVIINLNMQGMQSGSRFYITDTKEVLHSTRNPNYYGTNNVTEGAMNALTQDGKIRQTYDIYQTNGTIINSRMRDVQQSNGYFTLQAQSRLYSTNNNTINEGYNDFSAIYMSGDGLSFVGDFNKHYVEPFMYSGALTSSADDKWQGGAAITLWGNISHETLLEHDFQYELGSGLVIDIWGNFHLMYSSVSWNVNDTRGVTMLYLDQKYNDIMMGNMFGANVPGVNPDNYSNGSDHIFKFTGGDGHITIGRMWMSTFGTEGQANSDADFHLRNDNGWFRFFSGVASSDGTFHTISSKEDKYDIALLDTYKSINAIQNTDFARFHYKNQHDRAESYQKGVVIDNSNKYSVDNSFVDDNGKTLNIMNLVATLADVVKEQQKQISELNAKVAYLEINK